MGKQQRRRKTARSRKKRAKKTYLRPEIKSVDLPKNYFVNLATPLPSAPLPTTTIFFTQPFAVSMELTRICPIRCDHCWTDSGPHQSSLNSPSGNNILTEKEIRLFLDNIYEVAKELCITGGEPFVARDKLDYLIKYAHSKGLKVVVATSAYWAVNRDKALDILRKIEKPDYLQISWDEYHEEYVSFDTICKAIDASLSEGIKTGIGRIHEGYDFASAAESIKHMRKMLYSRYQDRIDYRTGPLYVTGRGINTRYISENRLPEMNSCMAKKTMFIDIKGNVYPCCSGLTGPGYETTATIGNITKRRIKDIIKGTEDNFWVNFIAEFGPSAAAQILRETVAKPNLSNIENNLHKNDSCHLCTRMFGNPNITETIGTIKNSNSYWPG